MDKSKVVMKYPSGERGGDYVTLRLDRYTAERLLLALTQALEPTMGYRGKHKDPWKKGPGKKGKAFAGRKTGLKL
jgi:hypothetical protein